MHRASPAGIEALLAAGADVNALRDASGFTPLHTAFYTSPAAIELLLAAGADVDARDDYGRTPLYYVARDSDSVAPVNSLVAAAAHSTVHHFVATSIPSWQGSCRRMRIGPHRCSSVGEAERIKERSVPATSTTTWTNSASGSIAGSRVAEASSSTGWSSRRWPKSQHPTIRSWDN